mmetsp:Transcript_74390/g.229863  ORF Transcript_74390/g.229863 Transcript_74390/m.229863 type:complete len:436 (-) Transcript_74390:1305-2612(-)
MLNLAEAASLRSVASASRFWLSSSSNRVRCASNCSRPWPIWCSSSSAFDFHVSTEDCSSCSDLRLSCSNRKTFCSESFRSTPSDRSAASRCSRSLFRSSSNLWTFPPKSSRWEICCSSTDATCSVSSLIFASQSSFSFLSCANSSSSVDLAERCWSSSRFRRSCSLRWSRMVASRTVCFSRCSSTSRCKSALFRIRTSQRCLAVKSSASMAWSRSEPCFSSSATERLTSSIASRCESRSRRILSSSSLQRREDSSWACVSDTVTASLWLNSCLSWASNEPFVCMRVSLSSCAWFSVSFTCSKYWRWASKRPSTSVSRSWRLLSSPSSCALRTPMAWTFASPSSLAFETAASSSSMRLRASARSCSRRSMVALRCSRSVSFSSSWLCRMRSAALRDWPSASRVCCTRSSSCLWAMTVRSASSLASSRSLRSLSPSC